VAGRARRFQSARTDLIPVSGCGCVSFAIDHAAGRTRANVRAFSVQVGGDWEKESGRANALRRKVPELRRTPTARGYMPAISTPVKRLKRDVIVNFLMAGEA
jgi:hypothetical protein